MWQRFSTQVLLRCPRDLPVTAHSMLPGSDAGRSKAISAEDLLVAVGSCVDRRTPEQQDGGAKGACQD